MIRWIWILLVCLGLTGCSFIPHQEVPSKKPVILTTIYPVYEAVKAVVGDQGDVKMLIPPGVDAHDWEPSASAIREMKSGALLFYNGAGLEPMTSLLKEKGSNQGKRIELAAVVPLKKGDEDHDHDHELHSHDGHHHEYDPHIWLNPQNVCLEVDRIVAVLSEEDPLHAPLYEANGKAYKAKLQALDKEYEEALKGLKTRDIITSHAAFAYLADRYDLHQISAMGIEPDAEPTPHRMAEIIQYMKEHHIRVLFMDASSNPRIGEVIAEETGTSIEKLNPIESITLEERWAGKDYLSIMRENLEALKRGLH